MFPTFAVGGAQMRFASLANRFGRDWRHAIVALDGVIDCRARLDPDLDVSFPTIPIVKGDLAGNLARIRRLLRTLRPDVLVTSNWGSIEWALANLLPLVRHIHTEDGFGPEERHTQLRRRVWTRRLALRRSTVVLPSLTLRRIATDIWRLDPGRLHYIPNGIDLARFGAPNSRARPDSGKAPVLGIVAALRPEKNIARLLRAFHLAGAPGRLVIVGDGGERTKLEALAATLGISGQVAFTGYVAQPQSLYAGFDLFALSSDTEQMPLSVLEAMAAGLPVVATDVGDIRAMLSAENARFVVPQDDAALAAGLRDLMAEPALRQAIGRANRSKAERQYDQEAMFQAYAALLRRSEANRCSNSTADAGHDRP